LSENKNLELAEDIVTQIQQLIKTCPELGFKYKDVETFIADAVTQYVTKLESREVTPSECNHCGKRGVWISGKGKFSNLSHFEHSETSSVFCLVEDVDVQSFSTLCSKCFNSTLHQSSRDGYVAECSSCNALFTEEDLKIHGVADSVIKILKTRKEVKH
jgi:hypothetical protein